LIYLWRCSEDYPNRLYGRYNKQRGPNRFLFWEGNDRPKNLGTPEFFFEASSKHLGEWDSLCNDAGLPIVGPRIIQILTEIAPDDVEFLDVQIATRQGELVGYKLLCILNAINGLDHERSEYTLIAETEEIGGFRRLEYVPSCLGDLQLARDAEYLPHILVGEELQERFVTAGIRGVELYLPEEHLG